MKNNPTPTDAATSSEFENKLNKLICSTLSSSKASREYRGKTIRELVNEYDALCKVADAADRVMGLNSQKQQDIANDDLNRALAELTAIRNQKG